MNVLGIVVLSLKGASAAISMAMGFITNPSVLKVLGDVQSAIGVAEGILGGVHANFEDGVKKGHYTATDPNLGNLQAKKA